MSSLSILGLRLERLPVLPFRLPILGMDSRSREDGDATRIDVLRAGEPDIERNEGESR
jgi:hypothetical protein